MSAILRTIEEFDITGGVLRLPRIGAWTAEISVSFEETQTIPSGSCTIDLDGVVFEGFVVDAVEYGGACTVQVVGGAGGLTRTPLDARPYVPAPTAPNASTIVQDALADAGEALAPSASIDGTLPRWHRAGGGTAAKVLERVTERLGLAWRVLDSGSVWVGAETYPAADLGEHLIEFEDAIERLIELSIERATIRPGTTALERRVEEVVYKLGDAALRAELHYAGPSPAGTLRSTIEQALPPSCFSQLHGATVRRQNLDYTIDLDCDDARIGPITGVPLRVGLRAARVLVSDGDRVRLGFESGDESKPFATGLDQVDVNDVVPGMTELARNGDAVACGTITFTASSQSASLTIVYAPPIGFPPVLPPAPIVLTIPGIADGGGSIALSGFITEGSPDNLVKGKI